MSSSKNISNRSGWFFRISFIRKLVQLGHRVVGIDNMIGGYQDNVPKGINFYNMDCCDMEKLKPIMKGVDIVYHCAATARRLISIFTL